MLASGPGAGETESDFPLKRGESFWEGEGCGVPCSSPVFFPEGDYGGTTLGTSRMLAEE